MSKFTISFNTVVIDELSQAPVYRVTVSTAVTEGAQLPIDGNLLVIERRRADLETQVDVFYGLAKASDFAAMGRALPRPGHSFYRVATWTLVFYNLTTLTEAIALLKSQVNTLAADVRIYNQIQNNRYETHQSPTF